MRVGILKVLARRTRVLRSGGFGLFLARAETPYVKEDALPRLPRYETALERQIYRVQNNELYLRQAIWGGSALVSPQVLDIRFSGMCDKQAS